MNVCMYDKLLLANNHILYMSYMTLCANVFILCTHVHEVNWIIISTCKTHSTCAYTYVDHSLLNPVCVWHVGCNCMFAGISVLSLSDPPSSHPRDSGVAFKDYGEWRTTYILLGRYNNYWLRHGHKGIMGYKIPSPKHVKRARANVFYMP